MTKAKYPYPTNVGWSRNKVIAYIMERGACRGEADRWSRTRIPNCGSYIWWNGPGFAETTFFEPELIKKITKRTVAKWQREEARARERCRKRSTAMRRKLAARLDKVRTAPTIVIDTETTGLYAGYDEILELAIIDTDGRKLFFSRFRPVRHRTWREAADINGIYPEDVQDECPISVYRKVIQKILDAAETVIGYNVSFDVGMLQGQGFRVPGESVDVMEPFAKIYGEWSDYFHDYKWQKLVTCAKYYHYDWDAEKDAHGAMSDALATLYCWKKMQEAAS